MQVTVVLPCHNEALTVGSCVTQALTWIDTRSLTGEVLVIDNASDDNSATLARRAGATVIHEPERGYGRALRTGVTHARGKVVIFADADATYDLRHLDPFYDPIADDHADAVIGNRFADTHNPPCLGAMHTLGNRLLSGLTRTLTGVPTRDLHSGLRSFRTQTLLNTPTRSTGMEYATDTICHVHRLGLRLLDQPITLAPPAPGRRTHIRALRDGTRHLHAITYWATRPPRPAASLAAAYPG